MDVYENKNEEFICLCKRLLVIGNIYKYKELCVLFNEQPKTSDSKKAQLKRWRRFFNWENPTTHTYKIIEIYDEPKEIEDGRKNNGGVRVGSGAKSKVQEEFDYLFNAFLHREFNRNFVHGQEEWCQSYFFNSEISKYFGMYGDEFYNAKKDFFEILMGQGISKELFVTKVNEFDRAWSDINKKISEKRRSWIYNKISKIDGVTFQNGIIAYTDKKNKKFEYKDEYLDKWNSYMKKYIDGNKLKTEADVAEMGLWDNAVEYISKNFKGFERVDRSKKITFDVHLLKDYEWDRYEEYRCRFNEKLVDELLRYFGERVLDDDMNIYKNIIKKYVKL